MRESVQNHGLKRSASVLMYDECVRGQVALHYCCEISRICMSMYIHEPFKILEF